MKHEELAHRPPEWFQVMYNLAAQKAHLGLLREAEEALAGSTGVNGPEQHFAAAAAHALTLLRETASLLEANSKARGNQLPEKLRAFLENTVEPSSAVLLAGVIQHLVPYRREASLRSDRIQSRSELLSAVSAEASISAEMLVDYVAQRSDTSYRVRYNLSCYFAETAPGHRAPEIEESWDYLTEALRLAPRLEASALAEWASRDPSLSHLRAARREALRRLLALYRLPPDEGATQKPPPPTVSATPREEKPEEAAPETSVGDDREQGRDEQEGEGGVPA